MTHTSAGPTGPDGGEKLPIRALGGRVHKRVLKSPSRQKTAAALVLIIVRNLVTGLEKAAPTKLCTSMTGVLHTKQFASRRF